MKKIIVTVLLILVSNVFFAQSDFDKFEGQEGIGSILVNKKMFLMMGSIKVDANDKATQQYLELIKKLDNLKVFTTSNARISEKMKATAEKYSNAAGLEAMMNTNESGRNLKVWVRTGAAKNQIKEILMVTNEPTQDNQTVLMSLTGNFDIDEMAILIDKMKIPGGEELKKATKEK